MWPFSNAPPALNLEGPLGPPSPPSSIRHSPSVQKQATLRINRAAWEGKRNNSLTHTKKNGAEPPPKGPEFSVRKGRGITGGGGCDRRHDTTMAAETKTQAAHWHPARQ